MPQKTTALEKEKNSLRAGAPGFVWAEADCPLPSFIPSKDENDRGSSGESSVI